jgi:hypothetical protein
MSNQERRKHTRSFEQQPIVYSEFDQQKYTPAIMHNNCPDGMYFESEQPVHTEFDIFIKIKALRRSIARPVPFVAFRAKVRWCREMKNESPHRYGIGVQYMAKSHLSYGTNIQNANFRCDYCDHQTSDRLVHQTETGLVLCQPCLSYVESLPPAAADAVENLLIGNVI